MSSRPESRIAWRLLRRLLPARFRARHGDDILRTHIDRAGGAHGPRFWLGVVWDLLLTGFALRVERRNGDADREVAGRSARLDAVRYDLVLGVRRLARQPVFALGVALTLGLGIGANVTMFSILDRLYFSPPEKVRAPETLRRVFVHGLSVFTGSVVDAETLSYPDYRALSAVGAFDGVAARAESRLTLGRGEESEKVDVEMATASYFPLLGVRTSLGRFFGEDEDVVGAAEPVAVLSHGFWRRRFGGDAGIIGSSIDLGNGRYTVIGVAEEGFVGIDLTPIDLWLPLHTAQAIESGTGWIDGQGWYWLTALVRLPSGSDEAATASQATLRYREGRATSRKPDPDARIVLGPLIEAKGPNRSSESTVARALGAVALLVLLIACANVANLLLARGVQRRRTLAVQAALGLSRRRLMLQLMSEALLLAVGGGIAALLFAWLGGPLLFRVLLPDAAPFLGGRERVLVVTAGLVVVTALAAGLLPSLRAGRADALDALRAKGGGQRTAWTSRLLLSIQAAVCVILLVGAGLFLRSLSHARDRDLGFDTDVLAVQFEIATGSAFSSAFGAELAEPVRRALERVRALPGVASAAGTSLAPLSGVWGIDVDLPGPDSIVFGPNGPFYYSATGAYFETLGTRILHGRALTDADDRKGVPLTTVVSASMARTLWGRENVVGECLLVPERDGPPPTCTEVVGVAEDQLPGIAATAPRMVYWLPPSHPGPGAPNLNSLLVRVTGDPAPATDMIRAAIRAAVPEARFIAAAPLEQKLAPQLRSWRLGANLLSMFGLLALLVAGAGLYSVLSFDVAQRRFELGVRTALGAGAGRLVRVVATRALLVTGAGAVAGFIISAILGRLAESMLFGVAATDAPVYIAVAITLGIAGAAALAAPIARAAHTDPMMALRQD